MEIIKKTYLNYRFLIYILSCIAAAGINFASRIFLGLYMAYTPSIIVAYLFRMITAYTLSRLFVFEAKQNNLAKQAFYFFIISMIGMIQTIFISLLLSHYVFPHLLANQFLIEEYAHFIGICFPAFTSYLGHKYLSFK